MCSAPPELEAASAVALPGPNANAGNATAAAGALPAAFQRVLQLNFGDPRITTWNTLTGTISPALGNLTGGWGGQVSLVAWLTAERVWRWGPGQQNAGEARPQLLPCCTTPRAPAGALLTAASVQHSRVPLDTASLPPSCLACPCRGRRSPIPAPHALPVCLLLCLFAPRAALRVLNLNANHLYGSLPRALRRLRSLEQLLLSGNRLTGRLPPYLGSFAELRYVRLDNNQFTGEAGRDGQQPTSSRVRQAGMLGPAT